MIDSNYVKDYQHVAVLSWEIKACQKQKVFQFKNTFNCK